MLTYLPHKADPMIIDAHIFTSYGGPVITQLTYLPPKTGPVITHAHIFTS